MNFFNILWMNHVMSLDVCEVFLRCRSTYGFYMKKKYPSQREIVLRTLRRNRRIGHIPTPRGRPRSPLVAVLIQIDRQLHPEDYGDFSGYPDWNAIAGLDE